MWDALLPSRNTGPVGGEGMGCRGWLPWRACVSLLFSPSSVVLGSSTNLMQARKRYGAKLHCGEELEKCPIIPSGFVSQHCCP